MQFDTKIAVILRDDLLVWQKLNVTAFTVSGIASLPDLLGEPYVDGSDTTYLPMIKQPILIFAATPVELQAAYTVAHDRELACSIYTEDLFATTHDAANRAAVRAVPSTELRLVGMAVRGSRKAMDKVVKGLRLHA